MDKKRKADGDAPFTEINFKELRGRQSVRATFRLSEEAVTALSLAAAHLGIKQKSLFDHIIEAFQEKEPDESEIEAPKMETRYRVQKTFVLSRKTLFSIEKACEMLNLPRDILVEYSIRRLMPLIAEEKKKHRHRKRLLKRYNEMMHGFSEMLNKAAEEVGPDDPVFDRLARTYNVCRQTRDYIAAFIEKGDAIEAFDFEETTDDESGGREGAKPGAKETSAEAGDKNENK